MRASLQRVLHALTGRRPPATEAITIGVLPSMRRRRGWARSVERLLGQPGTGQTVGSSGTRTGRRP
jgi:hypothetical protein